MSNLSFLVDDVTGAKPGADVLSFDTLTALAFPCLNWCHKYLTDAPRADEIASVFRSHSLRDAANKVFPYSCHTKFSRSLLVAFEEFGRLRATLSAVSGITIEEVTRELRRPCSLLVTDWTTSLFDGALTPETHGFIDSDCMPPWDTWIALVRVQGSQGPACLLSWVPCWLAERVNFAIRVDAAQCLSWLLVDEKLGLSLNGWGRSWQAGLTGLRMRATLHGGPYDGIILDHNDINLYTRFLPVGIRKFVLMPPLKDWDAVRRGDKEKDGPFEEAGHIYELIRTTQGIEGRYDADGSIFAEASKEYSEGRQFVPQVQFTGQYFKCYRGDLEDLALPPEHFAVTDEKDREWKCVPVSREEGETGGFAEMLSRLGGEPSAQPLRLVILHCNDQTELAAKLADQID